MPPVERAADDRPDCDTRQQTDIGTLEQCLARNPTDVEVLIDLGIAYQAVARPDRAEAAYRRAIASDPRSADAHIGLGWLLLARHDGAGARQEAAEAARIRPAHTAVRQLADAATEASRR
jgi:Flp pilus assembly protein TadD